MWIPFILQILVPRGHVSKLSWNVLNTRSLMVVYGFRFVFLGMFV